MKRQTPFNSMFFLNGFPVCFNIFFASLSCNSVLLSGFSVLHGLNPNFLKKCFDNKDWAPNLHPANLNPTSMRVNFDLPFNKGTLISPADRKN